MTTSPIHCLLTGVGAWGPGFNDWPTLKSLLQNPRTEPLTDPAAPSPAIIPANERRRAPLPVKIAVEVSWQALQASGLGAAEVACVFGSGLGDTEITDYMCRELTTELKQLSPTKFHNSVHNAAAGYWTISSGCMKAANSLAAYHMTAGLALLEGITQCALQQEPVLITLFDTRAHATYQQLFACDQSFGAALVIQPITTPYPADALLLTLTLDEVFEPAAQLVHPQLAALRDKNPAAKILDLLHLLAQDSRGPAARLSFSLGSARHLTLTLGDAR